MGISPGLYAYDNDNTLRPQYRVFDEMLSSVVGFQVHQPRVQSRQPHLGTITRLSVLRRGGEVGPLVRPKHS